MAKSLAGLPLAAEQAAAYLSPRAGVSFDDYATEIADLIKRKKDVGITGDYPDTVCAAFVKSLETLGQSKVGKISLDILRVCAFLSPDGVDLALLTIDREGEILPAPLAKVIAEKLAREDALAALTSLSLLRQESGPMGPVFIFHRLLLEVVRDWMGEDARVLWGGAAVQLASYAFPGTQDKNPSNDPSLWPLCARLMPHVTHIDAHAPRIGAVGRQFAGVLNRGSLYLAARGDNEGALVLAERCVALLRLTRAQEPLQLANGLGSLGLRYINLNRLDKAEAAFREALEIKEPLLDPSDPSFAITLSHLSSMHVKRRDFAAAERLVLRAAEIMRAAHGAESAEYGSQLGNLDALYDDWAEHSGDAEKRRLAEQYSTQALSVTGKASGARHPHTAARHHNLGVLKGRLGDWPGAALDGQWAVATMLSLDLSEHPDTRSMAGNLAVTWEQAGQVDKAVRLGSGDISDLLPVIAQIEANHRAWVAEDPENRHFGPPSYYAPSKGNIERWLRVLAEASVDLDNLWRRMKSGEVSSDDFARLVAEQITRGSTAPQRP